MINEEWVVLRNNLIDYLQTLESHQLGPFLESFNFDDDKSDMLCKILVAKAMGGDLDAIKLLLDIDEVRERIQETPLMIKIRRMRLKRNYN